MTSYLDVLTGNFYFFFLVDALHILTAAIFFFLFEFLSLLILSSSGVISPNTAIPISRLIRASLVPRQINSAAVNRTSGAAETSESVSL